MPTNTVSLAPDLANAITSYLSKVPGRRAIGLADLTLAILQSAQSSTTGQLPSRLSRLGLDIDAAVREVERLTVFSSSVLAVRRALGGGTAAVAAHTLLAEVAVTHPEYAGGELGHITVEPSEVAPAAPVDQWLDQVRHLYVEADVAASSHQVIDGRLLILGLARLDPEVDRTLSAGGVRDALEREVKVRPLDRSQGAHARLTTAYTKLTDDAPGGPDLLGREALASSLGVRIRDLAKPGAPSFLVHIDGPWGAGKSTLFAYLRKELDKDFLVIPINAWAEQRCGVPWWVLLQALRREVVEEARGLARVSIWAAGQVEMIQAGWVTIAGVAVLLAGAAWFLVGRVLTETVHKTAGLFNDLGALGTAVIGGLIAATRLLTPGSRKTAREFVESNANPIHEVRLLFTRALRRAERPVVFLIDDLDRCDGGYVVEFLEVVQTLVRDPAEPHDKRTKGPFLFVAADGDWIRSAYEKTYDDFTHLSTRAKPLGYLFIEKIFQLHCRLPSITDKLRDAYYASLLMPAEPEQLEQDNVSAAELSKEIQKAANERDVGDVVGKVDKIDSVRVRLKVLGSAALRLSAPDIQAATEHELTGYAEFLEPNPRAMKLYVNAYGVNRTLRTLEQVVVDTDSLARWTIVEIRWPLLADQLRRRPDAVDKPFLLPDTLQPLLAGDDVKAVLHRNGKAVLTPDVIRKCAGTQ